MKKIFITLTSITVLLACNNAANDQQSVATASKDSAVVISQPKDTTAVVAEIYKGDLPCADCTVIDTKLVLEHRITDAEGTYTLSELRKGLKVAGDSSFETKGNYTTLRGDATNEDAVVIQLNPDTPATSRNYLVKKGDLQLLDKDLHALKTKANVTLRKF